MKKIISVLFAAASLTAMAGPIGANDTILVSAHRVGNSLQLSYSVDGRHMTPVGNNYSLLSSDYGAWGSHKKMLSEPSVIRDTDGTWYAVWAVDDKANQFATTHTRPTDDPSQNLSVWVPQDYPYMTTTDENVIDPVLTKEKDTFRVTYRTTEGNVYSTTSKDFVHWTPALPATDYPTNPSLIKCTWQEIDNLIQRAQAAELRALQDNTGFGDDAKTFEKLQGLKSTLKVDLAQSKSISPELFGIFFEDINYAADGGLYAELLQNRDFEYSNFDRKEWNHLSYWHLAKAPSQNTTGATTITISQDNPIHENNRHYATINTSALGKMLVNEGFDGIPVRKGEKYDFSVFLRTAEKSKQSVRISLIDGNKTLASTTLTVPTGQWRQLKTVLTPSETCDNAMLAIEPLTEGTIDLDFASLFPQKTFHNRPNGLRPDLAQTLADLKPQFVRFPGGCASHGNGIDNIYHWKATVGPLWERQQDRNIWHYHQSRGLGFYEYFQFCEDIGASPLPVLAAGVPCQNSSIGGNGQQGGIPWEADLKAQGIESPYTYDGKPLTMESYLQELLDLIEWANGDAKTSALAKMRADAGHPAPFGLKYLGIGNEDLISETFIERYLWLIDQMKKAHPEITVVGTVGPFWEGSDYEIGWDIARREGIEIVDEHYYNPIGWYVNHQDYYDKYPRESTKVYLGEWASKGNRWENALAEAIHITNIERNADVVVMSSYAPLLAREGHTQWNPDLIYFNGTEVKPTPNYYVQMLSGQNAGTEYIYSEMSLSDNLANKRVASSIVRADNGDLIIKLVNALPCENIVTLDIADTSSANGAYTLSDKRALVTQIATDAKQRTIEAPVSTNVDAETLSEIALPPYSFTVIRVLQSKLGEKMR